MLTEPGVFGRSSGCAEAAQEGGVHRGVCGEPEPGQQSRPDHERLVPGERIVQVFPRRMARGRTAAPMTAAPQAAEAGRSRKTAWASTEEAYVQNHRAM